MSKDVIETEFRLGIKSKKGFNSNVTKLIYDEFMDKLLKLKYNKKTTMEFTDHLYKNGIRIRKNKSRDQIIRKEKILIIDLISQGSNSLIDVRFSISKEIKLNNNDVPLDERPLIKHKTRTSFLFDYWTWDLTHTREKDRNTYEVELELKEGYDGIKGIQNAFGMVRKLIPENKNYNPKLSYIKL